VRILLAIGGSSHTEATLRLCAQLARRISEPLTILTVIERVADHPKADTILTHTRATLQPEIPNARTKVRIGDLSDQILKEAREGNYDLMIMDGWQGHNRFRHFAGDTLAVRVMKRTPCPMLTVQGKVEPIRRILLCDSGADSRSIGLRTGSLSELSDARAGSRLRWFAAQLADLLEGEGEFTVLHVMSQMSAGPGVKGVQLRASVEELMKDHTPEGELLKRDIRALERQGIHPRAKVRHGLVVDEILAEARDGDYDLVIIGANRGTGWHRILMDDLAHKIIVRLDRPVLVVR
jgi:nucleotide-binding universal stress UspA family protein